MWGRRRGATALRNWAAREHEVGMRPGVAQEKAGLCCRAAQHGTWDPVLPEVPPQHGQPRLLPLPPLGHHCRARGSCLSR